MLFYYIILNVRVFFNFEMSIFYTLGWFWRLEMENFGKTFKMIRCNKGFSLVEAARGVVSTQFLSKFEKGEADITVNKLNGLLNNILISWSEFMNYHDGNNLDQLDTLAAKLVEIIFSNDHYELDKQAENHMNLYKENGTIKDLHLAIMIKGVYYPHIGKKLSEEDIQIVSDFLKKIDDWYYYENFLFGSMVNNLPKEEIIMYYKRVAKYFEKRKKMGLDNDPVTMELYYTLFSRFVNDGSIELAQEIYDYFETRIDIKKEPNYLFGNFIMKHKKGILKIKQGYQDEGIKEVKDTIKALELVGGYEGTINSMFKDLQETLSLGVENKEHL